MNERQAIEFILDELKEQRRQDFDMYFEMRKYTSQKYNDLLNRLREIDERDVQTYVPPTLVTAPPKVEMENFKPKPFTDTVKDIFKHLPAPKSQDLTPRDLSVEHAESKPTFRPSKLPPMVEIVPTVENFLKARKNEWFRTGEIQRFTQEMLQAEWTNFSEVMGRVVQVSPYINMDESSRVRKYQYKP
jgi:hypothetical protein